MQAAHLSVWKSHLPICVANSECLLCLLWWEGGQGRTWCRAGVVGSLLSDCVCGRISPGNWWTAPWGDSVSLAQVPISDNIDFSPNNPCLRSLKNLN